MTPVEYLTVVLLCLVYFPGVIAKSKAVSSLPDVFYPVSKRNTLDLINSHHRRRHSASEDLSNECCASVTRKIAPLGGLSREGTLLQLYRSDKIVQKFYETTCVKNVESKPCKFIKSQWKSMCEQQSRYTYAFVKDYNVTQEYRIDYIKINSGCSCRIIGPASPPAINPQATFSHKQTKSDIFNKKWSFKTTK